MEDFILTLGWVGVYAPVALGAIGSDTLSVGASVTWEGRGVDVRSNPGSTATSLIRGAGAMVVIGMAAIVSSAVTPAASLNALAI